MVFQYFVNGVSREAYFQYSYNGKPSRSGFLTQKNKTVAVFKDDFLNFKFSKTGVQFQNFNPQEWTTYPIQFDRFLADTPTDLIQAAHDLIAAAFLDGINFLRKRQSVTTIILDKLLPTNPKGEFQQFILIVSAHMVREIPLRGTTF